MTTMVEIKNPCNIGSGPDFLTSRISVFNPIAARAITIKNLLSVAKLELNVAGIKPILFSKAAPKNNKMNHGKIFLRLTFLCVR